MNPTNKENAGLPPPSIPEQIPAAPSAAEARLAFTEQAAAGAERLPVPAAGPPGTAPTIPLPIPVPAPLAPSNNASTTVPSTALPADDGDLIEKEWVTKAKQIVERTRDDPYKQSEDLTLFKADYMKKRYGKTIKVSQ